MTSSQITSFLGETCTKLIPLEKDAVPFSPTSAWELIFTLKQNPNDLDIHAKVQKTSIAGIDIEGDFARVSFVRVDTATLGGGNYHFDIKGVNITAGEEIILAHGKWQLAKPITLGNDSSIPIFTHEPHDPNADHITLGEADARYLQPDSVTQEFIRQQITDAEAFRLAINAASPEDIPAPTPLTQASMEDAVTEPSAFLTAIGAAAAADIPGAYELTQSAMEDALDDPKSFREKIDVRKTRVFDYSALGMYDLPEFKGKLADNVNSTPTRATGLWIGDSVGDDIMEYNFERMWLAYGFGGYCGKTITNIIETLTSAGVTISTQNASYAVWPSSMHFTVTTGGMITWRRHPDNQSAVVYNATALKVYYIIAPGGGSFKVQYLSNAAVWTDVPGFESVSTAGTANLGIATIPAPQGVRQYEWRVVGVSGTCTIGDLAIINSGGFNYARLTQGGTDIATAMTQCPAYVVSGLLADLAPDLMMHAAKDDAGPLAGGLTAWQAYLNAQNPEMDNIYCGTYGASGDGGINNAANGVLQTHAKNAGKIFYDYWNSFASMSAYGFMSDITHGNLRFRRFVGQRFLADFALACGPLGGLAYNTNNNSTRSREIDSSGAVNGLVGEFSSLRIGGNGARATSAITSGVVTAINLTVAGRSYASPIITITNNGSGSGATATATQTNGKITGIVITNGGTGYNVPPTITITDAASRVFDYTTANAGPSRDVATGNQTINCASGTALTLRGTGASVELLRLVAGATNPTPITIFDSDGTTQRLSINQNSINGLAGDFLINGVANTIFRSGGSEGFRCDSGGLTMPSGKNINFPTSGAGTRIGWNSSNRFAFWGANPVAQQVLPTTATTAEIVALLQTLGLCRQS